MTYRLFSWELSYFSGKARAYLRYKERMGDLAHLRDAATDRHAAWGTLAVVLNVQVRRSGMNR